MKVSEAKKLVNKAKQIRIYVNCAWNEDGIAQDGFYMQISKVQAKQLLKSEQFVPIQDGEDGTVWIN